MIGARERASFAAGDLGFNFIWHSIELYLLYFYVSSVGLSPATASAIFLGGAIVDWLADPLIGTLVDRAASRISMRAWTMIGGSAASVALVIAFAEPRLPGTSAVVYAAAAHLLLRVTYSLGNIPYGALTARITNAPDDHVALTAARMQGAAAGGLIAAAVYALLPGTAPHGNANFRAAALLLGLLSLPAFFATYAGVRERVSVVARARGTARQDLGVFYDLLRRSPELRRILVTILAAGLSITVLNSSILFLFDRLDAVRLGYFAAGIPPLSLLLTAPLWLAAARRFGCVATLIGAAVLNATAILALPLASASRGGTVIALTSALVAGNGMSVMFWALLPGAVDALERRDGSEPCAARAYALGGMARKLAQAVAPQFVALGLMVSSGRSVLPGVVAVGLLTLGTILLYPPRNAARPATSSSLG